MKRQRSVKTQLRSNSGFTLVEVLVAITILSFGVMGLLSTMHSVSLHQNNSDFTTEATMLASDRLEEIKRVATNEPLGGVYGFSYFVDDAGFLSGWATQGDVSRSLTETLPDGITRTTWVRVFPVGTPGEDFTAANVGQIHMVEVQVQVAWTNSAGVSKNVDVSTVLQRRQFITGS